MGIIGDHSAPDLEPNIQAMVAGSSLSLLASMLLPLRMSCGQSEAKHLNFFLLARSIRAPETGIQSPTCYPFPVRHTPFATLTHGTFPITQQ